MSLSPHGMWHWSPQIPQGEVTLAVTLLMQAVKQAMLATALRSPEMKTQNRRTGSIGEGAIRLSAACPWVLYLPLVACAVIAGFLHYLFLACFTWMFLEGLHLLPHHREPEGHELHQCQPVQEEIHVPVRLWISSLVVAISAVFNPDGYGTP
ncbi:Putative EGF-like module-containing mucin-like hormone receptor-like 4 [Chelonia mydas]|uniref:Putative EGF-like module-containing mucin-like hormone receptor-like 4 n=1 Tax=Chelonia mydas TaxID=8469 RepID=M7CD96_CHEMY|nr:Putative EGF-like module-containing mucin-like hormone receptor-like 4 [Chelonia mydas]